MSRTTDIFLVRHGQPVLQNALLGSTDSPLSDLGWLQLESAAETLGYINTIISSPLSRCAAFAQQYAAENELQLVIDSQWKECFFGDWDGRTYQSLYKELPKEIEGFFSQPNKNTPPNGEKLSEFNLRIESAIHSLLKNFCGQKIALFTHAGVIRTLVAWCLQMDYSKGLQFRRFAVDYASVTHLSIFHGNSEKGEQIFPQLMRLNAVNSQLASLESLHSPEEVLDSRFSASSKQEQVSSHTEGRASMG